MTLPPVTSSSAGGRRSAVAAHPVISAVIAILIFAAIFFALYVPLYASATPKVGDFPFFYFYLLVYFGTIAAYKVATPTTSHWAGSVDTAFGHSVYIGLSAFIVNLAVSVILTLVFRAARIPAGTTRPSRTTTRQRRPGFPRPFRPASAPAAPATYRRLHDREGSGTGSGTTAFVITGIALSGVPGPLPGAGY